MEHQRLDKWLWCARLFKTRGIASDAIKTGRVSVDGMRAKPAFALRIGAVVFVRKPPFEYRVEVVGFSNQRVPAARVGELYTESEDSRSAREALASSLRSGAAGSFDAGARPTKKERRERERLKRLQG